MNTNYHQTPHFVEGGEKVGKSAHFGQFGGGPKRGEKGEKNGGFGGGGGGGWETLKVPKSPVFQLCKLVKIGGKTPPFWYSNN